jgi:pectate lyase
MLIGGGVGSIDAHYGTIHHNYFEGSEERTPRVRNGRVHVFNNLFEQYLRKQLTHKPINYMQTHFHTNIYKY